MPHHQNPHRERPPLPGVRRLSGAAARILLFAAAAGSLGCASSGGGPRGGNPFAGGGTGDDQQIRIRVDNREFNDATIYVIAPSGRKRLGIVTGKTERTFSVRWAVPQPLRVRIDLQAGPTCSTREVQADPGDSLDLIVDPGLSRFISCREE